MENRQGNSGPQDLWGGPEMSKGQAVTTEVVRVLSGNLPQPGSLLPDHGGR